MRTSTLVVFADHATFVVFAYFAPLLKFLYVTIIPSGSFFSRLTILKGNHETIMIYMNLLTNHDQNDQRLVL